MTDRTLSRFLAAAVLVVISAPALSASTIKSHAQKGDAKSTLTKEWDSLDSTFQKLDNEFNDAAPIRFLHDYILSGTYNTKDLPKFLQGDLATTTTTPAAKTTLPVTTEPPPLSITSASHSATGQVLSNLSTSTSTSKPVVEAQFVTTPEPSTALIGGALIGLTLAWRRLQRRGE